MLAKLYLPETLAYRITERGEPDRNALKVRDRDAAVMKEPARDYGHDL
jgi:hypothetical protein